MDNPLKHDPDQRDDPHVPGLPGDADHAPAEDAGVEPDDIDTPVIVLVGVISVAMTLCLVLAIKVLYFHYMGEQVAEKVNAPRYLGAESTLADQDLKITKYRVIDQATGKYAIPINQAKAFVLRDLKAPAAGEAADGNGAPDSVDPPSESGAENSSQQTESDETDAAEESSNVADAEESESEESAQKPEGQ